MDNQEYIKKQIGSVARSKSVSIQNLESSTPSKEGSGFMTYFLMAGIILMSALTIITNNVDFKLPKFFEEKPVSPPVQMLSHAEGSAWMSASDKRLNDLEASMKLWNNRLWLLALVQNESSVMSSQANKRYHPQETDDYITLDRDWKLSRAPRYLKQESEEEQQRIQSNVK